MRRLEMALAQQGPTLRVDSRRLEHKFGAGVKEKLGNSIIQNKVLMWLTQQEEDLRFILLEVDPLENSPDAVTVTPWTRCCIGQADVVLLTAMAGEKEHVSRVEHDMVWTTLSPKVDRGRSHGSRFSDLGLMANLQSSNSVGSLDSHDEDTSGDSGDSDGEELEGPLLGCHGRKQGTDIVGKHRHLILLHPESSAGPLGLLALFTAFLLCSHSFQVTLASPHRLLTLPVVIVTLLLASSRTILASSGTAPWLDARPGLLSHHHVRPFDSDHARLARYLAGSAVGLVLGGGGSRGLCHLGVLKALEEAGVPVDCVGGASQGAFMAALYARHISSTAMEPSIRKFCTSFDLFPMLRTATFPILSWYVCVCVCACVCVCVCAWV
jgi:hypothetical protein